jgi:phage I-like protein
VSAAPSETALSPVPLATPARGAPAAPAWVHLLPVGTFSGRDGRGPWRVTDLAELIARTRQMAGGRPLPVDYNHALDVAVSKGVEAPAAGWVMDLAARADGLWGRVEWTPRAARLIAEREYRYISPVIAHAPDGQVGAVLRVALTNLPNLGQITALNAKEARMNPEQMMARLRELLSLAPDADADAIVEAVRQLGTARNSVDPASYVPMELFEKAVAEAQRGRSGISRQAAEMAVDDGIRRGVLMPFVREWAVDLCTTNKAAFDAFVAKVAPGTKMVTDMLTSAIVTDPLRDRPAGGGGEDDDVFRTLGLSREEVRKHVRNPA